MLKIKENVKKSDLENYGFKYDSNNGLYYIEVNNMEVVLIDSETLCISIQTLRYMNYSCLDVLYDLMKLNYVESVNEHYE